MNEPLAVLQALRQEAAVLHRRAAELRELVDRGRAELDRVAYDCPAARRDRDRMLAVARRGHAHGRTLEGLADALLQLARTLPVEP